MARHPADLISLAFGLLFAVIGLVLLVGGIEWLAWEWVGPLAAIVLGGVFIFAARSTRTTPDEQPPQA